MKRKLLLDTHSWIWFVDGNKQISIDVRRRINEAIKLQQAYVAAISCWEVAMLEAKDRIVFSMPWLEWVEKSLTKSNIHLAPITPAIAVDSAHLPGDFHGDPTDRLRLRDRTRTEAERRGNRIARLLLKSREIDGARIQARRRPGLETAHFHA